MIPTGLRVEPVAATGVPDAGFGLCCILAPQNNVPDETG